MVAGRGEAPLSADLRRAREGIERDGHGVIFVREGVVLAAGQSPGIADLLAIHERLGSQLQGVAAGDKVVGRAAALVMRALGVSAVYARRIGEGGLAVLEAGAVPTFHEELVPQILDRTRSGPCPFEAAVAQIDDPAEAVGVLQRVWAGLRAQSSVASTLSR